MLSYFTRRSGTSAKKPYEEAVAAAESETVCATGSATCLLLIL